MESKMHIVITGAARGIGFELCKQFATEPGAFFSLVDIDLPALEVAAEELTKEFQCPAPLLYKADLTDIEGLTGLYNTMEKQGGPIDILVNNAGVMNVSSYATMEWEWVNRIMTLNFTSPMKLTHLALPRMLQRNSGSIINMASMAGVTPIPGLAAYNAAKAGIGMASETIAGEIKESNVHIMPVYPGPIHTDLEIEARKLFQAANVLDMVPVGDKTEMAKAIFRGWKTKKDRVVYPEVYEAARQFPGIVYPVLRMFGPQPTR